MSRRPRRISARQQRANDQAFWGAVSLMGSLLAFVAFFTAAAALDAHMTGIAVSSGLAMVGGAGMALVALMIGSAQ